MFRIPVEVHLRDSLFTDDAIIERLAEVQTIWEPARICFEFHLDDQGPDDAGTVPVLGDSGLLHGGSFSNADVWMVQIIPRFPLANGLYDGYLGAYVRDNPVLNPAPHPATFPASRTMAHELGHLLGLKHYLGQPDTTDSLMSSKNLGYALHDFEIATARRVADVLALDDRSPTSCGQPRRGQVNRIVRALPAWFPTVETLPE
ncbi:MAG TPA: hypothetical protein VHE30_24085 [Polyangiaceae bacterium]|nr:hypothetical protein [Polyangiaceae bacterium]